MFLIGGEIDRLESEQCTLRFHLYKDQSKTQNVPKINLSEGLKAIVNIIRGSLPDDTNNRINAVGVRVVHGGEFFSDATLFSPKLVESLISLRDLAPLHNQSSVMTLQTIMEILPNTPIVGVFDTSFHKTLPEIASAYSLPKRLGEFHRYGFHGISYQYVLHEIETHLGKRKRIIILHLGNGSSACAIKEGKSVDTSMGFTPLEGLLMGTRSGDIDPGLLFYLLQHTKLSPKELEEILQNESGLLGISGISHDVRDLEKLSHDGNSQATLALDTYAYRAAKYIGGYCAALDGLDTLVFTGGIGENSSMIRLKICASLGFIGIKLDQNLNTVARREKVQNIHSKESTIEVMVVSTNEELQIAKETYSLLQNPSPSS